ncbi:MAG: alternative ribosome rescue aminoacyl-tRNA hydrolase ArfB [Actinomycetota bacterium]
MDELRVTDAITIPDGELHWTFSPSGGPGGQHANKASTRAELSFSVAESRAIDEETRAVLLRHLPDDPIVTTSDESRSQWRNRQIARKRLAERLREALRPDPAPRRPTKPSRAARKRRVNEKRRLSRKKQLRRRPTLDD